MMRSGLLLAVATFSPFSRLILFRMAPALESAAADTGCEPVATNAASCRILFI
jgi:hypothetical protein